MVVPCGLFVKTLFLRKSADKNKNMHAKIDKYKPFAKECVIK